MQFPDYGINRKKLDRIFVRHGGKVSNVQRTGEIRYTHPLMSNRPRADKRRKDAASHLVDFVREAIQHAALLAESDIGPPPNNRTQRTRACHELLSRARFRRLRPSPLIRRVRRYGREGRA